MYVCIYIEVAFSYRKLAKVGLESTTTDSVQTL